MIKRRIIVTGASAGGVEALKEFVTHLPGDLKASVFVVLHIPPYTQSFLPEILGKVTSLVVRHPNDGDKIKEGHVYIAPPDHHLLIEHGRMGIKKGPKENRFRPAIDALFRSAAYVYKNKVIGIILSGALNDGTSGLWSIKRLGGIAIVQDPSEAFFPEMSQSAMEYVTVDHILSVKKMGSLLANLTSQPAPSPRAIPKEERKILEMEVKIATNDNAFEMGIMNKGELTPFTCPECHGALVKLLKGELMEYRCHTGHSFTASALLAGITEGIEQTIIQAIRGIEESVILMENIATHFTKSGKKDVAEIFSRKAKEASKKARTIHGFTLRADATSEGKYLPVDRKKSA